MADLQPVQRDDNNLVITQLQDNTHYAPFGAKDTDVQMYNDETVWGTLHDFFQEWQAFKDTWNDFITNAKFMQYQTKNDNYVPATSVKLFFECANNQTVSPSNTTDETTNNEETGA